MGDIVATIQADQDRVIRDDPGGILVVEGGPGTGKTVVALHRAAYLLYTHRKRLARRGILVIGPSATFLRYIDQVLPSLGENDVVLATTGSLFPGVDARRHRTSPAAARVKGGAKMAGVLAKAVAGLRQVPAAAIEVKVDGTAFRLTPRLCGQARAAAERTARRRHRATPCRTTRPGARSSAWWRGSWPGSGYGTSAAGGPCSPATRRTCAPSWPPTRPSAACSTCCGPSSRRSSCSPGSTSEPGPARPRRDERAAIARDAPGPWTPADVPLLDELAELLGPVEAAQPAAEAQARRGRGRARRGARVRGAARGQAHRGRGHRRAVPGERRVRRPGSPTGTPSRRAPAASSPSGRCSDRTWAYGHVIVDEAQELSAMDWRMVLRRCPARSMTVVGDLAQTAAPGGADSWAQVLDPVAPGRWRTARLTVNYRTPAPVMALAAALLPPGAEPPLSVRDSDESPWHASLGTSPSWSAGRRS